MSMVRDKDKCIARVSRRCGSWSHPGRCENKAGHGPSGQYCKVHDPAYIKDKEVKRDAAYAEWVKANRQSFALKRVANRMLEVCRWIKQNKQRVPVELSNTAILILRDYEEVLK